MYINPPQFDIILSIDILKMSIVHTRHLWVLFSSSKLSMFKKKILFFFSQHSFVVQFSFIYLFILNLACEGFEFLILFLNVLYIYIKVYEHECRLCADTRVRHYKTIHIAHAQRALSLSLSHKFQLEIYVLVNHRNSWEWDLRVFWVNIAKSEVNLRYRYYSKLFGILRREIEFGYYRCRNSPKV